MVLALLAVVLQVGNIMVVSVGVVATPLAPDQTFDVTWRQGVAAALCLTGLVCITGLVPAAAFDSVHHHHLADAVRTEMFHKLLFVLSLKVTRLTVEWLFLLSALGGRAVCSFGALLSCFCAGWGMRCSSLRRVISLAPAVFLVVSYDHSVDRWSWRLRILYDTELCAVLVVITVPDESKR